ncbi:MAG: hypothetical protein HDT35_02705 [Clostridiales bacterium]|nr:hypothetical protein [Clostridiales bacterium]
MKKDYMARLERAARWRLPPQEAEDVIADYRDIVSDPPRTEEELRREVGDPEQVIKLLVSSPRAYRIWQAAFAVMAACILMLGISPTGIGYPIWRFFFDVWTEYPLGPVLAVLGAATALVWFRRQDQKKERPPKAIRILLAVFLVYIGGILLFCLANTLDYEGFCAMLGTMEPLIGPKNAVSRSMYLCELTMIYTCPLIALVGLLGLVKARTGDRRWAAVYVLALTAILTALLVLHLATSPIVPEIAEDRAKRMLVRCSVTVVIGLIGSGVSLC